MHLPDGFLSNPVCLATGVIATAVVSAALLHTRKHLHERQAPLMGMTAAFIFAAQMINYPVGLGTSGHVLGATLAALLLGPLEASLILALVLIVQCLLFNDGGLSALGANVFNMGVIAAFSGWAVHTTLGWLSPRRFRDSKRWFVLRAALAAWVSVVLASAACASELVLSGTTGVAPHMVFGVLSAIHALIGVGEAVITAAVLNAVLAARPEAVAAWTGPTQDNALLEPPLPTVFPQGSNSL